MAPHDASIRNVSDTALWVAMYRARETDRPDAIFRDPYARRLAGPRGERIFERVGRRGGGDWPFVARTHLFDTVILDEVARGADLVLHLAAGLDTRPYRLALPAALRWVEVDLPAMLDYKTEMLKDERPGCALERVALDLSNAVGRRDLFARLGREASRVLVVTEGLLIYFAPEQVGPFARDLAGPASFRRWAIDLASPGLLRMLSRDVGADLEAARAPLRFAPAEGPAFFEPHGWSAVSVRSFLKEAARLGRLPWFLRLLSLLPDRPGGQASRPWAAVCLLERGTP